MDTKKKVEKLDAEELEKRTAPFAGLPEQASANAELNAPGAVPSIPRGPQEVEILEADDLSTPGTRPEAAQEGEQVTREAERLEGND